MLRELNYFVSKDVNIFPDTYMIHFNFFKLQSYTILFVNGCLNVAYFRNSRQVLISSTTVARCITKESEHGCKIWGLSIIGKLNGNRMLGQWALKKKVQLVRVDRLSMDAGTTQSGGTEIRTTPVSVKGRCDANHSFTSLCSRGHIRK